VQRLNADGLLIGSNGDVVESETPPAFGDFYRRMRIPSGFTESVLNGDQVQIRFTTGGEGLMGDLDSFRLSRAVYTVLADVLAASGIMTDANARLPELTSQQIDDFHNAPRSLTLEVSAAGRRVPSGFEQSVPGTTVMFTLLVLLTSGATALIIERRSGILRRLGSAPIGRRAIVLGKWGGKFGLAVIQVCFALLVGHFALGVDYGPELPMLLVTLAAYMALIASLGIFLGNFATTEGQAVAIGVLAANVLAALGGCFWPIEVTPDYMQRLALFLPTGWMMDAMHKLMIFQNEWDAVLPHFVGMCAGACLLGMICARRFRFE
jgi:ABC-type polysaccharide/polyol phosphate export permease